MRMEMACIGFDERGVKEGPDDERGTEFQSPKPHVSYFFKDMGRIIGASDGQLVQFIFVKYNSSGDVHGQPISEQELRRKKAF